MCSTVSQLGCFECVVASTVLALLVVEIPAVLLLPSAVVGVGVVKLRSLSPVIEAESTRIMNCIYGSCLCALDKKLSRHPFG